MKKIKSLNVNIESVTSIYCEHSIYELTEEEMKKSGVRKKYLVDQTYSDYAMENMDLIEIIKDAEKKSNYVYGVAFANTVEEAELAYKNAVLECRILDLQEEIKTIAKKLIKQQEAICNEICFEVIE